MSAEVITSYLASLGFAVDTASQRHFEEALRHASDAVDHHTSGITKNLMKWQFAITSAFGVISGAVVGLADKVAMADQQYRLFGERMFLSQPAAKKLSIALEQLGASMEEIAWDPELHERFEKMIDLQDRLQQNLGINFEANMKGIRNLRMEFANLRVTFTYLGQALVSRLFEKLGYSIDSLQGKLEGWTNWLVDNLPEIADKIARFLFPILKHFGLIVEEIGGGLKELGTVFTNLVSLLTGDDSIRGAQFSFEKLGTAIQDSVAMMATFVHWMVVAEKLLAHLANAAILGAGGHFKDAAKELSEAAGDFTKQTGAIFGAIGGVPVGSAVLGALGGMAGGAIGSIVPGVGTAIGATIGGSIGAAIGAPVGAAGGAGIGMSIGKLKELLFPGSTSQDLYTAREGQDLNAGKPIGADLIASVAKKFGVNPLLALAIAQQESGRKQYDSSGNVLHSSAGALGVMQLMPETAKGLGVNPNDPQENIIGGVKLLSQLIEKYHGNLEDVLTAYNAGPGYVGKSRLPSETVKYIASVESLMQQYAKTYQEDKAPDTANSYAGDVYSQAGDTYNQSENSSRSGDVNMNGDVNVYVTKPGASTEDVHRAAYDAVRDAMAKQTRMDLVNLAPAW
jgi:hypothetical protein